MEPGERSDPGRREMKAFFRRISLAEAQDALVLDRFGPTIDKKSQRNSHIMRLGPALFPGCSYSSLLGKLELSRGPVCVWDSS